MYIPTSAIYYYYEIWDKHGAFQPMLDKLTDTDMKLIQRRGLEKTPSEQWFNTL